MEPKTAAQRRVEEYFSKEPITISQWLLSQDEINPCSEIGLSRSNITPGDIIINNSVTTASWRQDDLARIVENTITADKISTNRISMRQKSYKRDYDEDTITIEVPGVTRDEIEVFTQKNVLFIKIREEAPITYAIREDDQSIRSVKLDLGILTIVIDNAEKRKLLEID